MGAFGSTIGDLKGLSWGSIPPFPTRSSALDPSQGKTLN